MEVRTLRFFQKEISYLQAAVRSPPPHKNVTFFHMLLPLCQLRYSFSLRVIKLRFYFTKSYFSPQMVPDVFLRPCTSDGTYVSHNYFVDWSKDFSWLSFIFAVHVTVDCNAYEMKIFPGVRFICLMLHPSTVDAAPVLSESLFWTAGHVYSAKHGLF